MQGKKTFHRDSGQGTREDSSRILIFSFLFLYSANKTTQEIAYTDQKN